MSHFVRSSLSLIQRNSYKVIFSRSITSSSSLKSSAIPTQEQQVAEQIKRNKAAAGMIELVRDFIDPADFYTAIKGIGIDYFCGVPDSLLKDFCAYVTDHSPAECHKITANEGSAVALAAGYHLATGKSALVYLQNSGIGNAVNPLMSLASPEVYAIPMLLLVGWRGEPGKRDEPQHLAQGAATPGLLASLGIPFQPLPDYIEGANKALISARKHMESSHGPYAFLVKRQTFLPYTLQNGYANGYPMAREDALKCVVDSLSSKDVVVGTTGMLSRELFEHRKEQGQGHERDFLTVGSMGHASAIALGIALAKPQRRIVCLDGDGAALMHMGTLATVGQSGAGNLLHVVVNNGAHESVGGQPTEAGRHDSFSFATVAHGCGYHQVAVATTPEEVYSSLEQMLGNPGPNFLEIKVSIGSREDVGRPNRTPEENKADFMHFLAINHRS